MVYNLGKEQFITALERGLGGVGGIYALARGFLTPWASEPVLTRLEIPDGPMITDGSHEEPEWYERVGIAVAEWGRKFAGDLVGLVDAILARGERLLSEASEEENPLWSALLYADALTGGIAGGLLEAQNARSGELLEDPSIYSFLNWLTLGTVDMFNGALFPEEPLSLDHFMNLLGTATIMFGAGKVWEKRNANPVERYGYGPAPEFEDYGDGAAQNVSPKGLIGREFEDWLTENIGGSGSFKVSGREFDGGLDGIWWEAKSGNYWVMLENNSDKLLQFKTDMGDRLKIAFNNGATYELFSNTEIPQSIKNWLTNKGIKYTEFLD